MAYFDAASAEPLHPSAREALLAALDDGWADPARLHREGRRARLLLDGAREAGGGRTRLPRRRAVLHQLRHPGRAPGRARRPCRPAVRRPRSRPPGRERGRALQRAERRRLAGATTGTRGHASPAWTASAGPTYGGVRRGRQRATAPLLACLQSANHEVGTLQPVADVAAERASAAGCRSGGRGRLGRAGCRCRTAGRC